MKKIFFLSFLAFTFSPAFSQIVAKVDFNCCLKVEPGKTNQATIYLENTQKDAVIPRHSDYKVTMSYRGSTRAGKVFNNEVDLGYELGAGRSTKYYIKFTGPTLPGKYEVDISLKRGNSIHSNVERETFYVEEKYKVAISAATISIAATRKSESVFQDTRGVQFYFKNIGPTTWPEGTYSLRFSLSNYPSNASSKDRELFNYSPRTSERWGDFDPGDSEDLVVGDFKTPKTPGTYKVKVELYFNGKLFDAEGSVKIIEFKINPNS